MPYKRNAKYKKSLRWKKTRFGYSKLYKPRKRIYNQYRTKSATQHLAKAAMGLLRKRHRGPRLTTFGYIK